MYPLPLEQVDLELGRMLMQYCEPGYVKSALVSAYLGAPTEDKAGVVRIADHIMGILEQAKGQAYWADRIRKAKTIGSQIELCKRIQLKEAA